MTYSIAERVPRFVTLLWGLRTHAAIIMTCSLGLGIALPFLTAAKPSYQAEVNVVALQLDAEVSARVLPAYGREVFTSDAMVRQIVTRSGIQEEILADQLVLVAAEDSIVLSVRGRAEEPLAAARLADLAAAIFVIELNRGRGIGTFGVQSPATIPTGVTSEGAPASLKGAAGATAGALLGLGLIALLAAVRRPVLQSADAQSAVGKPVIGTVVMPAARVDRRPSDPYKLPGLVPLARALLPLIDGKLVLASSAQCASVRQRLLILLALTLAPFRGITVNGPPALQAALGKQFEGQVLGSWRRKAGARLELVDGDEPADSLQGPQGRVRVVLVVRYGAPAARVRRLAANYLDDEILGVVIVEERGALSWRQIARRDSMGTAPKATDPQPQLAPDAELEPETQPLPRAPAGPSRITAADVVLRDEGRPY